MGTIRILIKMTIKIFDNKNGWIVNNDDHHDHNNKINNNNNNNNNDGSNRLSLNDLPIKKVGVEISGRSFVPRDGRKWLSRPLPLEEDRPELGKSFP